MRDLHQQLRDKGYRLTKVRKALLDLFSQQHRVFTAEQLQEALQNVSLKPHMTTIYRELDFLLSEGLVREIQIPQRASAYEWNDDHHHHVVCTSCEQMETIEDAKIEKLLESLELSFAKKGYRSLQHSL